MDLGPESQNTEKSPVPGPVFSSTLECDQKAKLAAAAAAAASSALESALEYRSLLA